MWLMTLVSCYLPLHTTYKFPKQKMIHVSNTIKHDDKSDSKETDDCLHYSQV